MVHDDDLLAQFAAGDAEAFVAFHTERYREYPMVVRGAGAGGAVTAAGVLADILRLAQNIRGRG